MIFQLQLLLIWLKFLLKQVF